ncbi:hypothetical protein EU805_12840 [Salipiger sp. IMCC34102]|uniref:hypothetical protein n=1 Tax=Salipiger sp. IMCC34102 TaxID=2510647 RepID=UPI00101D1E35|nr:hypothetical protein [Salipiger sp. IMCC34102]RYH01545.1 hypothetical protein EU805_12840 [Salipiger sp. IMCC34102]
MSAVTVLQCAVDARCDPSCLSRIYETLGDEKGEQAICRTLGKLAVHLSAIQSLRDVGAGKEIATQAGSMSALAREIGLLEVSEAADHVRTCAEQNEDIALEATLARLERGFDVAVGLVWDLRATPV